MALTFALTRVTSNPVARQPVRYSLVLTNTSTASVSLELLSVDEVSKTGAIIEQPGFLTPNAVTGTLPSIAASGTLTVPFTIIPSGPTTPGPSPQSIQGGVAPGNPAVPASPTANFQISGTLSDDSTAVLPFQLSVLSSVAPFPVPEGGAAQFGQGACSNLIAAIL